MPVKKLTPRESLLGISALVMIGFVAMRFFTRPTVESEVRRIVQCWDNKNFDCVSNSISRNELSALGLEPSQVSNILKNYFESKLKVCGNVNRIIFESTSQGTAFTVVDSNQRILLGGLATLNEGKLFVPNFMTQLVMIVAEQGFTPAGMQRSEFSSQFSAYKNHAESDGKVLSQMGMQGIVRGAKLESWDEWADYCRKGLERKTKNKMQS